VPRGDVAQMRLPDEWEISVVGIRAGRNPRALNRVRIRRDVDMEVLQAQEIASRGVRDRPHAINADAGDVVEPSGAGPSHCQPPI